ARDRRDGLGDRVDPGRDRDRLPDRGPAPGRGRDAPLRPQRDHPGGDLHRRDHGPPRGLPGPARSAAGPAIPAAPARRRRLRTPDIGSASLNLVIWSSADRWTSSDRRNSAAHARQPCQTAGQWLFGQIGTRLRRPTVSGWWFDQFGTLIASTADEPGLPGPSDSAKEVIWP